MTKPCHIRAKVNLLLLLVVLPLIGIVATRKPILQYIEFPPLTRYVEHAGFSWPVFIALAAGILGVITPFILRVLRCQVRTPHSAFPPDPLGPTDPEGPVPPSGSVGPNGSRGRSAFPWWFWLGLLLTAGSWVMAWTRFAWFAPLQQFTFTPIWVGYVLVVNGLTYKRTGHCILRDRPLYMLGLFVVSAVFWWCFEYLNRFIQNWYYVGIGDLTSLQYFLFATLPFSTVLPAVLGTNELLKSFPRLTAGLDDFIRIPVPSSRILGWLSLAAFSVSLAAIGIWPDYLFPLVWISPLFIITGLQSIRGERTIFSAITDGKWQNICLLALSALICGFFWEMWNYRSMAKWIYAVPFVNRFKIFEMPILGYAGYLPFGLECAVVAEAILGGSGRRPSGSVGPNGSGGEAGSEEREAECGTSKAGLLAGASKYGNAVILAFLGVYFFLAPGVMVVRNLSDPNIRGEGIPKIAWRLHRYLTPRYEAWARERVASGKAGHLNLYDIPSTEWPMFGSVYYLWATEALQRAWEQDNDLFPEEPRVYARGTIEASADLIVDPVHHSWVKTHWGEDYMHTENVFFRSLIIAGLTSYENLVGDGKHLSLLRDQVDSLAAELDASPHGVLEDYPYECYPIDVFSTIACIKRADKVLGTDHGDFISRSIRAFEGDMLDSRELIPYLMHDETGEILGPSRGVGNSYTLIFAPGLWPERAKDWYRRYEEHFWQEKWWAAGFREYPRELEPEFADYLGVRTWYDVDAGPIIGGFSPAANAFGLAAAKVNGRLDHAYTLGTQVLTATWPLPHGGLMGGKILSSQGHAPYLGEACLLFFLAQQPHSSAAIVTGGHRPALVYFGLLFYFGLGLLVLVAPWRGIYRWRAGRERTVVPCQALQFASWIALLAAALILICIGHTAMGMVLILLAQLLPRSDRSQSPEKSMKS